MRLTRRQALGLAVSPALAVVLGCRSEATSCRDLSGLGAEDVGARLALEYQDEARDPARACGRCAQFIEAEAWSRCGRCLIVRGPIHRRASCRAFAARPKVR